MGAMRTDTELLSEYSASGAEGALAEIAARHAPMVFRTCLRALGDTHLAEDASQAVFVVLVRKARSLRREGCLAAWLRRVARNIAARAQRDRSLRTRREEEAGMDKAAGREEVRCDVPATDIAPLLDRELDALPRLQRQAVTLQYLEGRSSGEAAGIAGCPEGTFRRRVHDGLENLRRRLARRGTVLESIALGALLESTCAAPLPESLLPSVMTAAKSAATGAAIGVVGAGVMAMAEGAISMMFWAKVKIAAAVTAACLVLGGAIPLAATLVRAGEPVAPREVRPAPDATKKPEPMKKPAQPAGPAELDPLTIKNVSCQGAFAPDGRHFVYPLMPAKGKNESELFAIEVDSGKRRSLGIVPLKAAGSGGGGGVPTLGKGGRGGRSSGRGRNEWIGVIAVTNDLGTVFLNQSALRGAKGKYLAWSTKQKKLVELDPGLARASLIGASANGARLAFRMSRAPCRVALYDVAGAKLGRPVTLSIDRDSGYRTESMWAGNRLMCFVTRREVAKGLEVRSAWPQERRIGLLPTSKLTLVTPPGAKKPVDCYPMFCGAAGGKKDALVFLRGDRVLVAEGAGELRTRELCGVSATETHSRWKLPVTVDARGKEVYAAWCDVARHATLDFTRYMPTDKALGTRRKVTLKVLACSLGDKKGKAQPISLDASELVAKICARALVDYGEAKVPKSGSGVLARQPWVTAVGAREGRVLLLLRLRVWYGICGQDYHWPLIVDLEKRQLAHAPGFKSNFSSGVRSGPPGWTHAVSPRGDAFAVIGGRELELFRAGKIRKKD